MVWDVVTLFFTVIKDVIGLMETIPERVLFRSLSEESLKRVAEVIGHVRLLPKKTLI